MIQLQIAELALSNNHSLLNADCLTEKQHIGISVFGLTRLGLEPTIYRTRGEHANHYATDAGFCYITEGNSCKLLNWR
jgi:hypothetical protein